MEESHLRHIQFIPNILLDLLLILIILLIVILQMIMRGVYQLLPLMASAVHRPNVSSFGAVESSGAPVWV